MSSRRPLFALAAVGSLLAAALSSGSAGAASSAAYQVYEAPRTAKMAYDDAVEPTIGANWKNGRAMVIANTTPYIVSFNTARHSATWTPSLGITTKYTTLDPILWSERETGRTIVSQLAGTTSLMDISVDGGESWQPAQGGGPSGVDHQTVGGGPYSETLKPLTATYPRAVWYCSQGIASAFCSISTDGGLTYGPSKPLYTLANAGPLVGCGGLHGHVNVRPDGTAMVPNKGCLENPGTPLTSDATKVGLATNSDNNNGPWTVDLVPDSTTRARMDPYVDADAANTTYLAYVDGTDKMKVAVKKKGGSWAKSVDVGKAVGVKSSAFPLVIGGSAGRVAVAYLGSKTGPVGDLDAQNTKFEGTWQLYISTSLDSGRTWSTQQVTKDEKYPVQVGCIRKTSNTCNHRNLYDFNGISVDQLGRVLIVAADGCLPDRGCINGVQYDKQSSGDDTNVAFVVRQECGPSLYAAKQAALDKQCKVWRG